jgi:hypothetical protein
LQPVTTLLRRGANRIRSTLRPFQVNKFKRGAVL